MQPCQGYWVQDQGSCSRAAPACHVQCKIEYVNKRFALLLGRPPEEMVGLHLHDIMPAPFGDLHPKWIKVGPATSCCPVASISSSWGSVCVCVCVCMRVCMDYGGACHHLLFCTISSSWGSVYVCVCVCMCMCCL